MSLLSTLKSLSFLKSRVSFFRKQKHRVCVVCRQTQCGVETIESRPLTTSGLGEVTTHVDLSGTKIALEGQHSPPDTLIQLSLTFVDMKVSFPAVLQGNDLDQE